MKIFLKKVSNKNIDNLYFYHLIQQYRNTVGKEYIPDNFDSLMNELYDWIRERKLSMDSYRLLLDCMDIEYNHSMTAEIGKGVYDSICYDKKTTLITPYIYKLDGSIRNNVIQSSIQISDISDNSCLSSLFSIDMIMTENPYNESNIKNWESIFNNSNMHAVVGVYGKNYDKDKTKKIRMLENFKQKIMESYQEEFYRLKDDYAYVLATKKRFKSKDK